MNIGKMRRRMAVFNQMENPYITDGLISMFDAEWNVGLGRHEETPTEWKDLAGNITLSNIPSRFESNYVLMDKTPSFTSQEILDAINQDNLTVEMIVKPLKHGKNSNNIYIHLGSTRGFWIWDNSGAAFSSASYREPGHSYNSISIPWSSCRGYLSSIELLGRVMNIRNNNNIRRVINFSKDSIVTGTHLLGNSTSNIEIYSLRFYGKVLSQEEVAHNAQLDKDRFGLNL